MNKSTFVGAVGSITIYQGTREESCPPLYSVIGKQTLILAVELVEQQTCPSLSGHGQEKSWQVLTPTDTHGWKKLVEVQPFWGEIPACYWRGKNELGCTGDGRKNFTNATLLPQDNDAPGWTIKWQQPVPQGNRSALSKYPGTGGNWRNYFLSSIIQSTKADLDVWEKEGDQARNR